jgi:hypothetical protein
MAASAQRDQAGTPQAQQSPPQWWGLCIGTATPRPAALLLPVCFHSQPWAVLPFLSFSFSACWPLHSLLAKADRARLPPPSTSLPELSLVLLTEAAPGSSQAGLGKSRLPSLSPKSRAADRLLAAAGEMAEGGGELRPLACTTPSTTCVIGQLCLNTQ